MRILSKREEQYLKCLSKAEPGDLCEIYITVKYLRNEFAEYQEEPAVWMSANTRTVKVLDQCFHIDFRIKKPIKVPILTSPGCSWTEFVASPWRVLVKRIIKAPQKETENAT